MKIAVCSDTLGTLPEVPNRYDLFIHCGNFCPITVADRVAIEAQKIWMHKYFCPWLREIDSEYKVVVPGHYDAAVGFLEPNFSYHIDGIYLRDSSATVGGNVIHSMPWLPLSYKKTYKDNFQFIASNRMKYQTSIDYIPDETSILITRVPPYGILDEDVDGKNTGDKILLNKIKMLSNLKMHFFGLSADMGGKYLISDNVLYANSSMNGTGYMEIDV